VATVDAPPDIEPMLMARVADALPNVTPISVAAMVSQVRGMLDKLGIAVIVTAGVTIASGLLVLAGSIGATRQRQRYQTALLKIIGATRGEILQIVTIEYLVLGTSAAIVGGLLGTAAAWLLISLVLKIGWSFTPLAVLFVAALAIFLIIAIGLISTVRLLAASSAKTLRTS
jgi:putative ABC transport system permease protein